MTFVNSGTKTKTARFKFCIKALESEFGEAISNLYITKHFRKESKTNARGMALEMHASFKRVLQNVDWMDDSTRKQAVAKLDKMALMVGYPDELTDEKVLLDYYSTVPMTSHLSNTSNPNPNIIIVQLQVSPQLSYYDNVRMMSKWKKTSLLAHLGTVNDKLEYVHSTDKPPFEHCNLDL